jgi:hypothetical protein
VTDPTFTIRRVTLAHKHLIEEEAMTIEPTQEDREAAAAYYYSAGGNSQIARLIREGHRDNWFRVQAFARHRVAHSATQDGSRDDGE